MRSGSRVDRAEARSIPIPGRRRGTYALSWVIALCGAVMVCQSWGAGFSLVSEDEYRQLKSEQQASARSKAEADVPVPKALDLNAPQIIVKAPDPHMEIRPPLRLEMRFQPAADAQIDVSSFQVVYKFGLLRKDITDRIRPFVTLTRTGVSGESSAAIPAGEHTLIIRIRDTLNRVGEQVITFRVGAGTP
jgi:hypothetical protein